MKLIGMTKTAIKKAFQELDATEQAEMLKELAGSLVESLTEEDVADIRVFERRRKQEPKARSWSDVRTKINARHKRKRSPSTP